MHPVIGKVASVWRGSEDKLSLGMLIAMNLIPLGGAIFAGWDVGFILLVYWAENVVIGAYNVLKMVMARGGDGFDASAFFLIPFFTVHYGGFCFVHGVFVLVLGQGGKLGGRFDPFEQLMQSFTGALLIPVLGLAISHGVSFFQNYLGRGENLKTTAPQLMAAPYGRIVILHVVILFGGFVVMLCGSPLPLLILLVLVKIAIDLGLHAWSHSGKKMFDLKAMNERILKAQQERQR